MYAQTKNGRLILKLGYKNYKELYLDYVNNFLTIAGFSGYHEIDIETAEKLINSAKYLYKN